MFSRNVRVAKFLAAGTYFGIKTSEVKSATQIQMEKDMEKITGWERLQNLFKKNEYHEYHPELEGALIVSFTSAVGAFFYGGMKEYVSAYHQFLDNNEVTKFANVHEARVMLARETSRKFLTGGLSAAIRVGIGVAIFMLTSTAVSVYRGKNGIVEYPIAGSVTMAVYKWNLGIRGMFSGVVTGGFAGFVTGSLIYGALKLTGKNMTDFRYFAYSIEHNRNELLRKKEQECMKDIGRKKDLAPGLDLLETKTENLRE